MPSVRGNTTASALGVRGNGYKLLGQVVWRGGRWYLRRRMPSARTSAATGVVAVSMLAAAVLLGRRLLG
jgi:hypothetical protein